HTLADHFGKAYIHQVGELAYTDKFSYLELIVIHRFAHRISEALSFFTAGFCFHASAFSTTCKFSLGFLDLFLYFFLVYEFIFSACDHPATTCTGLTLASPGESAATTTWSPVTTSALCLGIGAHFFFLDG